MIHEKTDKRRLYWLIDSYLSNKINTETFCDEYYYCYGLGIDSSTLTDLEQNIFGELMSISSRVSEFGKDFVQYPDAFYTEDELRQKTTEARDKLKIGGKMQWKEILRKLEQSKQWDEAIEFMQEIINKNSNDMDAYIAMNYLLANLITEEHCDKSKYNDYIVLSHYYFDESYAKFSNNPEYLFFTGITTTISDWYMDIDMKDVNAMLEKAAALEPDNLLYLWGKYSCLKATNPENLKLMDSYKKRIRETSSVVNFLKSKGAIGEYLLEVQLKS